MTMSGAMNDIANSGGGVPPAILITADGMLRRVGVEIEFLGPSARVAAEALA
jgi:hypothetical protein